MIRRSLTGRKLKYSPITLTIAVLADDKPRLFVAVQVYPPSSVLVTELIIREPFENTFNLSPVDNSMSP